MTNKNMLWYKYTLIAEMNFLCFFSVDEYTVFTKVKGQIDMASQKHFT